MPPKKKAALPIQIWLDKLKDPINQSKDASSLSQTDLEQAYGLTSAVRRCVPPTSATKPKRPIAAVVPDSETEDDTPIKPKKKTYAKGKDKQSTLNFGKAAECSPERCVDDPLCLKHLGQKQWSDKEKAFKLFANAVGLPDDPAERERDHSKPVGLRVGHSTTLHIHAEVHGLVYRI